MMRHARDTAGELVAPQIARSLSPSVAPSIPAGAGPGAQLVSVGQPSANSRAMHTQEADLPRWPLAALLFGFPLIWILGVLQFFPTVLALIMVFYMVLRGNVRVFTALWFWAALCIWVIVATINLERSTDIIAWGLRFVNIFNVGIFSLYFYNLGKTFTVKHLLRGLAVVWLTMIVLGVFSLFFPDLRINTPMSYIMPAGLKNNALVYDYVSPRLAEVQQPWGAPEPFNRPAAPFPYTNSWGLAYSMLVPAMVALWIIDRSKLVRWGLPIALVISIFPALETSNRGMLLGLGIATSYVVLRLALAGNFKIALLGFVAGLAVLVTLIITGAIEEILGRQEYSDSTGGRMELYRLTWEAVKESPLIGYGTPRMEASVGVSMGTQGYFWSLMFCYGLVGLFLFLAYLLTALGSTVRLTSPQALWLHAIGVITLVQFVVYSFDIMQLSIMFLAMAALHRIKREEGASWHP